MSEGSFHRGLPSCLRSSVRGENYQSGKLGSSSCLSPNISEIQGTEMAETQSKVTVLCTGPHHSLQNPLPRQTAGDHQMAELLGTARYLSVKVGEGNQHWDWPSARPNRRAAVASFGPLRTLPGPCLASAPGVGRETGTPAHLSLKRLGPKAPPERGGSLLRRPSTARSPRRSQDSGTLGQPGPAWLTVAACLAHSFHFGAGLN